MGVINELVTKFSFKGNLAPLLSFNKSLSNSITSLSKVGAGFIAVATAVEYFTSRISESNNALIWLSKNTGISIASIQSLGYASSQFGSSVSSTQDTIANLTKTIANASLFGNDDFSRLGISIYETNGHLKNSLTILREVGDSFKRLGVTATQGQVFASRLGIDPSLVPLLLQSNQEIDKYINKGKQLGTLSIRQGEIFNTLNKSLATLKYSFNNLRNQLAVALAPTLTIIIKKITNFINTNKELITRVLKNIVIFIGNLYNGIVRLIPVIKALLIAFIGFKVISYVFSLFTNPIKVITSAIVGLLLVVEDLIVAFDGGKSVIRSFFQTFFGFDITPILRNWVTQIKYVCKVIFNILGGVFGAMADIWRGDLGNFVNDLKNIFMGLVKLLWFMLAPVAKIFTSLFDKIANSFGFHSNATKGLNDYLDNLGNPTTRPLSTPQLNAKAMNNNNISNNNDNSNKNVTINQNVTNNISSTDPKGASNEINNSLNKTLQDAYNYYNKGGYTG